MKTIVCATDFSRPAAKVSRYAAQLARQTKAKLILLHATHPAYTYSPDMQTMSFDAGYMTTFEQNKLNRIAKGLEKLTNGEVEIRTIVKEGFAVDILTAAVKELKPDILIMSTVGDLPKSSELLGNVTTEMIKKSPVPLMLVPPKAQFKSYENVYLAIDLSKQIDAIALQKMIDNLKTFKAVITVFSVVQNPESKEVKTITLKLRELLKDYPHVINIVESEDFVNSLLANAQLYKADLMIVFPGHHNLLRRWFVQSNTEELIFKSNLPLMAIS